MVLPLLKLGTLVVKTLSKPLAAKLKQQAAYHPKFRQIIIDMAQMNHRISTRMQRRIYSHATDVAIRPLDEEKAVQAAVDLIGELFVFTGGSSEVVNLPVAALLLVLLLLLVTSVDFMPVARLIFGFVPPVPFLRNSVSFFEELLL
ncbi:OPA3-like protein [Linum perenne]